VMTSESCRVGSHPNQPLRSAGDCIGHNGKVLFCIARSVAFTGIVALVAGCGDGRPHRVPVSGQVLIDGKPLTYGDLKFVPEGARPSYAKLDSNGGFTLTCYDGNDGAVPGLHRVAVSGSEVKQQQTVWHAPIKYANFRTSGISVQIEGPTNSLVIELGSDGRPATVHIDKAQSN